MAVAGSGARVVKSSGETETFDPNVITAECVEAGVEFYTAAEVAFEVSKEVFDGINGEEIQRKILRALYDRNPEAAERYKRFHSMFVRTSKNTIERFDRKRIVSSLVKETSLPKEVAEIIAKETEIELRRLNLDFTSGPLIREIVNVKLLEHGYEGARSDYTRLGMPVYDAAQFIETAHLGGEPLSNPEIVHKEMANSIFREYSLLKVLPLHIADAHMKGDFHIHDLEYFVTRPFTAYHDLRFFLLRGLRFNKPGLGRADSGPAKHGVTAVLHALKALSAFRANFSSSQGLHSFNVWLAPFLKGLDESEIRHLAQTFLYEIAQGESLSGQGFPPVDIEIEYGIPEVFADIPAVLPGGMVEKGVTYSDYEKESAKFAHALMDVYKSGDFSGSSFDSPKMIHKLRKENEKKSGYEDFLHLAHEASKVSGGVGFLNMVSSSLGQLSSAHSQGIILGAQDVDLKDLGEGSLRLTSLQAVTLNLPRIAYRAGGKDERFFETLEELLDLALDSCDVKRDAISSRIKQGALPFLSQKVDSRDYFELPRSANLVGYSGLNEAVHSHLGEELHEGTYGRDFGVSIIKRISEILSTFTERTGIRWYLSSSHPAVISQRFAALDSGQFPEMASARGSKLKTSYTDSCNISEKSGLSPIEKVRLKGPFYPLSNGGLVESISIGEQSAEDLFNLTRDLLKTPALSWRFVS